MQGICRSAHLQGRPRLRLRAGRDTADGGTAEGSSREVGGAGADTWFVDADGTAGTGEGRVTPNRRNRSMSRCRVRAAFS